MAISVTCGSCGSRIKAPDQAAGRKAPCPSCGEMMAIPVPGDPAAVPVAGPPSAPGQPGRSTNGLGLASLILGIVAILICWVPLIGLGAWPLGGLGIVLGVVGVVFARKGGRTGSGTAVAGITLGGLAILASVVVTSYLGRAIREVAQRAAAEQAKAAQAGPAPATTYAAAKPGGETLAALDRNGDGRLNADEVPPRFRDRFGTIDLDDDGHADAGEWDLVLARAAGPPSRGKLMAAHVVTASDDFVVYVFHNGDRVPVARREMIGESYGATSEKISVEVREGDWLVFNVANNQLRWGGACYFAAAGLNPNEPRVGFASERTSGRWSYCDDPGRVPRFVADPGFMADHAALAPAKAWGGGEDQMKQFVPGWAGGPVWGERRNTWIKFVARPDPAGLPVARREEPAPAQKAAPAPEAAPAASSPFVLKLQATLTGPQALVYSLGFTPDGATLISCGAGSNDPARPNFLSSQPGTLIAWDVATARMRLSFGRDHTLTSAAVVNRGKAVAVEDEGNVALLDLASGKRSGRLAGPGRTSVISLAASPDGKRLAAGYDPNSKLVVTWNLATGKVAETLRGHAAQVARLAFSPDGKQLASGGSDGVAILWDLARSKAQFTMPAEKPDSPVVGLAYATDGKRVAVVADTLRFFDPATGREVEGGEWSATAGYTAIAFAADGRLAATASGDYRDKVVGVIDLRDASTGRKLATVVDEAGLVRSLAFSPDGKTLASTSEKAIKLWDVALGP